MYFLKLFCSFVDAIAIAEKSFNRIEGRIRGTLMNKRFPIVCSMSNNTVLLLSYVTGKKMERVFHTLNGYKSPCLPVHLIKSAHWTKSSCRKNLCMLDFCCSIFQLFQKQTLLYDVELTEERVPYISKSQFKMLLIYTAINIHECLFALLINQGGLKHHEDEVISYFSSDPSAVMVSNVPSRLVYATILLQHHPCYCCKCP